MKNLFKILLGLFLVTAAISCSKDDATAVVSESQDVVFDITNFVPQVAGKNVFAKDNDEVKLPECSDAEASYVEIMIGTTPYTLQLVTLNDKTETEVIKLAPGDYDIKSFIVYDVNNIAIWASPTMGSYYQALWNLKGVNDLTFTVDKFEKRRIALDVLCYKPFDYEKFGFAWFAYAKIEIHTVCFFGDICTKFYEEFHKIGSAYNGQTYDGYDFPAIFEIVIKNGDNVVNDPQMNSNVGWYGAGAPLCIEYPDYVGVDETFTFDILLTMPDGSSKLVYTGTFDDTDSSAIGNDSGFGGSDGIFDFVVGNCSYDGNDANMELPPYLPVPTSGKMTLSNFPNVNAYLDITFSDIVDPTFEIFNGAILGGWCAAEHNTIFVGPTYDVDFYSSLELTIIPSQYQDIEWGSLNWIMNNLTGTSLEIQEAIWQVVNSTDTDTANPEGLDPATNAFALEALTHTDFIPTVGDYAIVICDAVEGSDANEDLQLLIVRVDP
ncbi:hypothetical protein [uncultured Lutibacter sp.]|uniref:hypothetical protein n=1 Tax=uncultured Lutibacter sp. TaxID=437739 RepID=UPI00261A1EF8|nr:hypothetical protein [uncultured Lutibacter sp.]